MKLVSRLLAMSTLLSLGWAYCAGDAHSFYKSRVEYLIHGDKDKEQLIIKLVGVLKQPETPVYSSQNNTQILMHIGNHTVALIMSGKSKDVSKDGRAGNRLHTDVQMYYCDSNGVTHSDNVCVYLYLLKHKTRLLEAKFSATKGTGDRDLIVTVPIVSEKDGDEGHDSSKGPISFGGGSY